MSPRIKRTRVAVGAVAIVGLALTGCSTDTSAGSGDGGDTLTIVSSTTEPEQAVIDLFAEENPDITVKVTTAPAATYSQVVATQLGGGTAADIIRAYPGNGSNLSVIQATDKGFYSDLSGLDFVADLPESLKPVLSSQDGAISAVPVTTSAIGGVYNATVMADNGLSIPTTWSEVLSYCADAQAAGLVPYGLGLKDAWTGQFVPYALAATLVSDEEQRQIATGELSFADSHWQDVFEKYSEMKDAGCFTPQPNGTSYANVSEQMVAGTTSGWVTLSSAVGEVSASSPSGTDIRFAAFPATDDAAETVLSNGIGVVYALNAKSEHADAAKELLEFFTTPEAQAAYSEAANTSPALDAGDAFADDPVNSVIADYTAQNLVSSWPDQLWPNPNVQQAHFDGVQGLFAGSKSVADVLTGMDKALQD